MWRWTFCNQWNGDFRNGDQFIPYIRIQSGLWLFPNGWDEHLGNSHTQILELLKSLFSNTPDDYLGNVGMKYLE